MDFDFESIEREYERYWRAFIAEQLEDAIAASHHTETHDTAQEAKWFREGLRFAVIITRFTESTDPYYHDETDRMRRTAEGDGPSIADNPEAEDGRG